MSERERERKNEREREGDHFFLSEMTQSEIRLHSTHSSSIREAAELRT